MPTKFGLSEARAIVEAMLEAAAARKLVMAAAVVDFGGDLIHLSRMDGGSALNARMSYNKAYTAVKWQRDTRALKERLFDMSLGDARREVSWFGDPLYTPVWGGIVLRASDGTMLGALGESGGTPEQDEEIGQIGAKFFKEM
jgi:uncharacterized protein GlcG (DUF336 family)